MKKTILAAVLLAGTAFATLPAKADVVLGGQNWTLTGTILDLTAVVPGGNQPQNIQCIICGDNQPQQAANFGYTDFKNNGGLSDLAYFSTNVAGGANPGFDTVGLGYDRSFLAAYLLANGNGSLNFTIGIDVNDNNVPQVLESFYFLNLTQHTVLAAFSPGPGGTPLPNQNNGTGFPDYTLSGFDLNRGDILPGDQIIFFARISNASDGPDSFFIQATPVPGPIVGAGLPGLIAACSGLFGLNWYRRRRNTLPA
jgi:hypothetical protein